MSYVQGGPRAVSASSPLYLPPCTHHLWINQLHHVFSVILKSQNSRTERYKKTKLIQVHLGQTVGGTCGSQAAYWDLCFPSACEGQ